ncbi:MAG TPA: hypothetical protein P5513_05270 [Candidatus Diapherotrites archaeon]|nr:hypothetical protein [Candidatus Diapherotrites archaeon]
MADKPKLTPEQIKKLKKIEEEYEKQELLKKQKTKEKEKQHTLNRKTERRKKEMLRRYA